MSIYTATTSDLADITRLLADGRFVHRSIADEDLILLIEQGGCVVAESNGRAWGMVGVAIEERPPTLPAAAATRARVQAVSLLHGHWPSDALPGLLAAACARLRNPLYPVQIGLYGAEKWLERSALEFGFTFLDRVVVLQLDRLGQRVLTQTGRSAPARLRAAYFAELPALAALDADAFAPIWHFSVNDMAEMFMRGRLQVAVVDDHLVGYSALLPNSKSEAQLARLAVHPLYQRRGVGRQLLNDAIAHARSAGYSTLLLNTQASNARSLSLYRSAGFRLTGDEMTVLAYTIEAAKPT